MSPTGYWWWWCFRLAVFLFVCFLEDERFTQQTTFPGEPLCLRRLQGVQARWAAEGDLLCRGDSLADGEAG